MINGWHAGVCQLMAVRLTFIKARLSKYGALLNIRSDRNQILGKLDLVVLQTNVQDRPRLCHIQVDISLDKLVDDGLEMLVL